MTNILRFTRISSNPANSTWTALAALRRGWPLGRRMTTSERLAVALASAAPRNHLTLSTSNASLESLMDTFRLFIRRIERRTRRPFIYFGTAVQARGEGGYHLHLLLWNYLPAGTLHGQTRSLGLGKPDIKYITPRTASNVFDVVSYVVGQREPVFGTKNYLENQSREKNKRQFLYPHMRTLEKHNHQLFVALTRAKDKTLSDDSFFAGLPRFIKE